MRDALTAFLGTDQGEHFLTREVFDFQLDRVGFGVRAQAAVVAKLREVLKPEAGATSVGRQKIVQAIAEAADLRQQVAGWTDNISPATRGNPSLPGTSIPPPNRDLVKKALAAGDAVTSPELKLTLHPVADYLLGLFGANPDPHAELWALHGLWTRLTTTAGALIPRAADVVTTPAFTDLVAKVKDLDFPVTLLTKLNAALAVTRQQQRIAAAGAYPRVNPWLDELVGTFDQLMGDLTVKPDTPTADEDPLRQLGRRGRRLRPPAARPPARPFRSTTSPRRSPGYSTRPAGGGSTTPWPTPGSSAANGSRGSTPSAPGRPRSATTPPTTIPSPGPGGCCTSCRPGSGRSAWPRATSGRPGSRSRSPRRTGRRSSCPSPGTRRTTGRTSAVCG